MEILTADFYHRDRNLLRHDNSVKLGKGLSIIMGVSHASRLAQQDNENKVGRAIPRASPWSTWQPSKRARVTVVTREPEQSHPTPGHRGPPSAVPRRTSCGLRKPQSSNLGFFTEKSENRPGRNYCFPSTDELELCAREGLRFGATIPCLWEFICRPISPGQRRCRHRQCWQ